MYKEEGVPAGVESHNPYFNRWFSAIRISREKDNLYFSHNPYFNRWFSAISGGLDGCGS